MFYNIKERMKDVSVIVRHGDEELEFPINKLINRRLKSGFDPDMFKLLNVYVDYKGDGFKKELIDNYFTIYEEILQSDGTDTEDFKLSSKILNMFDFEEVKKVIRPYVKIPSTLADEWNEDIEVNKEGTRVQTYLKSDYLDLVTLLVIFKSIIPIIGLYTSVHEQSIPENFRTYIFALFFINENTLASSVSLYSVGRENHK